MWGYLLFACYADNDYYNDDTNTNVCDSDHNTTTVFFNEKISATFMKTHQNKTGNIWKHIHKPIGFAIRP